MCFGVGLLLLPPAFLAVPAAGVPVAAIFERIDRDHDLVAFAGTDVVVAARAAVVLDRFVGLHVPDGELGLVHEPKRAQISRATAITTPLITNARSPRWGTRRRRGSIPIGVP